MPFQYGLEQVLVEHRQPPTMAEVEDMAAWEQRSAEVFAMADFGEWFARM